MIQPELRKCSFLIHSQKFRGSRLYKTGDLARFLPPGSIEFIGRRDHLVKVHGFRIELGDIEAALLQHPSIKDAAVITKQDKTDEHYLIAFIVSTEENGPTGKDLYHFLKDKLPSYMIPSVISVIPSIPLMANGKIDRNNLALLDINLPITNINYVGPRDLLEFELTKIWENVFENYPIGIFDNFYELGGQSLLAVRLLSKINQAFEKNLPLSMLFEFPTIERMGSFLRNQEVYLPASPLVPVKPHGKKYPFFFIHPSGGNVFCYMDLAKSLDDQQPLYCLQAVGLNGEREPFRTIEEMASYYIKEIQLIQPNGPYSLGGWSMGGVIAFEMAQQLKLQGQDVTLLAIIDIEAKISKRLAGINQFSLFEMFIDELGLSFPSSNYKFSTKVTEKENEFLQLAFDEARKTGTMPAGLKIDEFTNLFKVYKANIYALQSYKPCKYSGSVILFKSLQGDQQGNEDLSLGWRELVSEGIKLFTVPGDHYSIIRSPNVDMIAKYLNNY